MSVDFKIVPLDSASEKRRAEKEMKMLRQMPNAGLACILSSWLYFGYNFWCIQRAAIIGWEAIVPMIYLGLEIAKSNLDLLISEQVPPGLTHLLAFSVRDKIRRQPLLRLLGNQVPTVDVFITYCGEGLEIIMDTVRAAYAVDYPKDRFRIIVLDDKVSNELKLAIKESQITMKNLYYSTRNTKVVTHTKAANLNHGLEFVSKLPGGSSELMAVLDVDMIPLPNWLRALVPHLLQDRKVGLANPPQHLYNIPDGDPFGQSMDILFDVLEPLKHCTNSAWCTGSGWVARRSAVDQLGGVPEESINDDILLSVFLRATSWNIVYVHEPVQWGMVPSTLASHIKQQKRWCAGVVSTAALWWNPRAVKLSPGAKFGALFPAIAFGFQILTVMVTFVAFPILLLMGFPLVVTSTTTQLKLLTLLAFLRLLAAFHYNLLSSKATNYHLSIVSPAHIWPIPFQFKTLFQIFLSVVAGHGVPLFTPSGLVDFERKTTSVSQRIKLALWDYGFVVHSTISLACAFGVARSFQVAMDSKHFWQELFVRAGWPPAFLLCTLAATDSWTPIGHVMFPATPVTRDTLLDRDSETKLAYPTAKARDQVRTQVMANAAIDVRLRYLNAAAYLYASSAPETAAHLMQERFSVAEFYDRTSKDPQLSNVCQACGAIMIPGCNARHTISSSPRSPNQKSRQIQSTPPSSPEQMQVECLTCRRITKAPLQAPKRDPRSRTSASRLDASTNPNMTVSEASGPSSPKQDLARRPPSANLASKKRAKTRKLGLQDVLEKSKSNEPNPGGFGLNLMDLMKEP
ncbi:MAG: hypothetical protein Q9214_004834 [Letrouitia sp. 1 TL-2023]